MISPLSTAPSATPLTSERSFRIVMELLFGKFFSWFPEMLALLPPGCTKSFTFTKEAEEVSGV